MERGLIDAGLFCAFAGGSMSYSEYAHTWKPQHARAFFLSLHAPGGSNSRLFKALAKPECTKETELQAAWSALNLPQRIDNQVRTLRLHDTHQSPYLDGRKPDLTFTVPEQLPSPFSAVVIAELTVDDFSPSKEGELLSCVHRALEVSLNNMRVWSARFNMCSASFASRCFFARAVTAPSISPPDAILSSRSRSHHLLLHTSPVARCHQRCHPGAA